MKIHESDCLERDLQTLRIDFDVMANFLIDTQRTHARQYEHLSNNQSEINRYKLWPLKTLWKNWTTWGNCPGGEIFRAFPNSEGARPTGLKSDFSIAVASKKNKQCVTCIECLQVIH